ncbi:DUF6414 family protein [Haloterrigena salina]|uniref:DUF6414 family protein n=1 Tax=Haloterrigena salina TaxID=504937 RepID=UPI001360B33C|nr:hypothetical protein [Haloterrigena salina]
MTTSSERVPGFVYLDMDRVKSISARLDQGYVQERIEAESESEQETERIMGRVRGFLFGPGGGVSSSVKGEQMTTEGSTSRTEDNKALHHYHFTLLEEWLEGYEDDWFHDINDLNEQEIQAALQRDICEGDIIRINIELQLRDFQSSFELLNGFLDSADDLERFIGQISEIEGGDMMDESDVEEWKELRDAQQMFETLGPLFEMFENVLPQAYSEMVVGKAPIGGDTNMDFWALLQEEKLETEPVELIAKYQNNSIPSATIIARVDTITEPPTDDPVEEDDSDLGDMLQVIGDLGKDFGFKVSYPDVAISPIAVYR